MSWDVIIPFLRPIERLLRDPDVSDILVNGSARVFVEERGRPARGRRRHADREILAGCRTQYRARAG